MEKQGLKRRGVVLVPCPYQGHITPMLQLGTILHSKGFFITIVHTQFNSPNPSNHPEFKFKCIPDGLSDDIISSGSIVDVLTLVNSNCQAPFLKCLIQMMEQQDPSDEIVCIIYDELMYFSEAAAHQLKLQSIILRTTNAATVGPRLALLHLKMEGFIPLQDTMLHDPVPGLHPLRFKDLPISRFGVTENYLELISNMYTIRTSSAVVWNTMDCLEQSTLAQIQQQCQVPIFPIGPLHKFAPASSSSLLNEDTRCISWLNNQATNSVLYVSLGSIASMGRKELVEMAWGLVNSKQSFLWVIKPTSTDGSEGTDFLPEGFKEAAGENGCIVKWAPQKEVLAHGAVGGFWSHCGWNSILESICEATPIICQPCFGDQRVNSRYVSHVWGIGLELDDKLERDGVRKTIRKLMADKEGEEIRLRAENLKEKLEISISKGGSSFNSLNKFAEFINLF